MSEARCTLTVERLARSAAKTLTAPSPQTLSIAGSWAGGIVSCVNLQRPPSERLPSLR